MDAATPPTDELSALVRAANDAGASYADLAKRAVDAETGQRLSKAWINNLANGKVESAPKPGQLRALAAALGEPLVRIQRAAARQYLDYKATELSGYSEDVRVVISHLAGMDRATLRRYRAMMEAEERAKYEEGT